MKRAFLALAASAALASSSAQADDFHFHQPGLDHVFLIVMENETNTDILGNPNAPFINSYVKIANQATNYFAVGHPSAPNYLEMTGGSNFGLTNDFWPNWIKVGCTDNAPGSTGCVGAFTPIAVPGMDNPVVATATNSAECNGQITITGAPVPNNCVLYDYPSIEFTPQSIADQLTARGMSWRSYQQSLPIVSPGVLGVNYSDSAFSNLSPASVFDPGPSRSCTRSSTTRLSISKTLKPMDSKMSSTSMAIAGCGQTFNHRRTCRTCFSSFRTNATTCTASYPAARQSARRIRQRKPAC
jgi:hypothetical protein